MVVAILTSDCIDFSVRKVIRNKEGHYIMTEESVLQEDKSILIRIHWTTEC